jgi:hypothetical protein
MRKACACGSEYGEIRDRGAQDCVFCVCGKFQYNAPRTETGKQVRTVSTVHSCIKPKLRARVLMRATGRCELCGKQPGDNASLHVGHLLSVKAAMDAGLSDAEINDDSNLAAMCDECNLGLGQEPVPLRLAVALVLSRARRVWVGN